MYIEEFEELKNREEMKPLYVNVDKKDMNIVE